MNFFKNLRTNYGLETIKIVRKAENTTRQLARHRNHLVFNLRCKGECVIPPSLRLKCPINSDKARNIVEKARKNRLRERIRLTNQKISHLQDKKRRLAHFQKRYHSSYGTGMQIAPYERNNPTQNRTSRSDQVIKGPEEQHF